MAHRQRPRVVLQDDGCVFGHAHCHASYKGSIDLCSHCKNCYQSGATKYLLRAAFGHSCDMDMAVGDVVTPSNQYKIHFCLAACALLQPVIILLKFMYKMDASLLGLYFCCASCEGTQG